IPFGNKFPYLMEAVSENNRAANSTLNAEDSFDPSLGKNTESEYPRTQDRMIAAVLYNAYKLWERTGADRSHAARHSDNAFSSGVNSIFGTEGIFSMRDNPTIHPLARLSAMGKSMMDAALRNMAVGLVAGGVGGILKKAVGEGAAGVTQALGDFLLAMGKTLLLMAFILYYVLPFLPFIYFMFAVSGWVKSIFEAVVAMPLWALSHITRMDGQGMPGPGANNGYFLILEIFLRPILILFGLLASISIFSALVNGLDEVFDLVVVNVTGFDREADAKGPTQIEYYRSSIDQFFFSVIYVIICYMMANSMFKMVDQVPNQILRWMGVSVTTFSEAAGDPAGELTGKIYAGGQMALGQVRSGGQLAALIGVTG
ncbi:MAG: DotA/TraY family protein, partial [Alphaproteobacteria bacterium]